jgi:shikimate dehydrogenase
LSKGEGDWVSEKPLRAGIIGDPVAHSISPAIQQPALDALGINAVYERWHTPADQLAERIASLREPDALGASVTVPHKLAVIQYVDEISPLATKVGAVNTVINRNGRLLGDNTDVHGFATSLKEACPDVAMRSALILGAGGAARAVVLALDSLGVREITLANRNPDRSAKLAADLAPIAIRLISLDEAELIPALKSSSVLVNATSLGWHAGETPIALDLLGNLPANAVVADLTYRDTDLLVAARERGLQTFDGLGMVVHQGARAFKLWTGQDAPVELMMAAAIEARSPKS